MLESFGFHGPISLRILVDKALISVVQDTVYMQNHKVQMHDLIQSMAFEIVRREFPTNPERRSRLWNPDEIYDVLKHNQGSDAIQGISLNMSQIRDLQLSTDTFKKMTKLRFLKFYSSWDQRSCTVNLPSGFDSFSESLRYLQWDNFPSESLPLSFCAEMLVELHLPNSNLKKLWDGVQKLANLRKINLRGSKYLMELPDISTAQNLEQLFLERCESLSHIDHLNLSLPRLHLVSVRECISLKSLKSEHQSKSIYGCSSLKEFSFSSDKIGELYLKLVPIKIGDFPIGHIEKLQGFHVMCSNLKNLPIDDMICCMRSLKQLHISDCGQIIDKSKLHALFDSLLSLQRICLTGAWKLIELPNNIKHLSRLRELSVIECKSLQSLPELPPSIIELNARRCTSLKTLQLTSHIEASLLEDQIMMGYLRNLSDLILGGCEQLYELPESIGSLFSLQFLDLRGSNIESLPTSIKHLLLLHTIKLSNCKRLRSLPELPLFIKRVYADLCISLEIVPTLAITPHLTSLNLQHCLKLENCYMESACFPLKEAIYRGIWPCHYCYPGRKVPEWFKSNQGIDASNKISIELPSTTTDLLGFVLCSVLSPHEASDYRLQCQLYYDGKEHTCSKFEALWGDNDRLFQGLVTDFDSHHVFLWCISDMFIDFGKTMDGQNTNYRPHASFEFSVVTGSKTDSGKTDSETDGETDGEIDGEADSEIDSEKFVDGVIEACGVCPIYASEYPKFIQQMELEPNSAAQKETCQDDYENLFHGILKYANFSLKTGECGNLEGSNIPKWFTYNSSMVVESSNSFVSGSLYMSVQVAPDLDKLMGFIFGFVIPNFSSKERDQCYSTFLDRLDYEGIGSPELFVGPNRWHYSMIELNSDNVFLWYDPFGNECILKRLKNLRRRIGCDTKIDLTFFFNLGYGLNEWEHARVGDCLIKEFGVRPIYVSEYTNFLQQEKLKVSLQTKRHRNFNDDQQQLPSTKKVKDSSIGQSIPMNSDGLDKFWNQVYKRRARPRGPGPTSDTAEETTSTEAEAQYGNI